MVDEAERNFSPSCTMVGVMGTLPDMHYSLDIPGCRMMERMNRTLEIMLRQYVDDEHTDWDQWLTYCILQYRIDTEQTYARERGADALYWGPHPEANAEPLPSTIGIDEYVTSPPAEYLWLCSPCIGSGYSMAEETVQPKDDLPVN